MQSIKKKPLYMKSILKSTRYMKSFKKKIALYEVTTEKRVT